MYTHFPPLPYSYTFNAIFICFFCVLFYTYNLFFGFLFSFSTNLIDTYVTVPIDVRINLRICLNSSSICIFLSLIPPSVYLKMYTHFPPLPFLVMYRHVHMHMCFDYSVMTPCKLYVPIIKRLSVPAPSDVTR